MKQLVIASNNPHKVDEIKQLIPLAYKVISMNEAGLFEDIVEDGHTLETNAIIKAKAVKKQTGHDCFADDSGLEVEALNGEPGVFSARYAGPDRSDEKNMDLLLKKLEVYENRTAQFRTVICLLFEEKQYLFEGVVSGSIAKNKTGNNGFGYDPIFIPEGYTKTFAEMANDEKNAVSHRGRAVGQLVNFLSTF